MKTLAIICFILLVSIPLAAQNYLRGEIRDEKDATLSNARILVHSTGYVYYSGSSGSFGIMLPKAEDSITISLNGYQALCVKTEASKYQTYVLKSLRLAVSNPRNQLSSLTKNLTPSERGNWTLKGETYTNLVENEPISARKYPETGFAIHTDKASYSNIRRFLNMNTLVPPDAVRTEELMNYFNFGYTEPAKDSAFSFRSYISDCPWNRDNELFILQVCAKKIDPEKIPPSNLVFLIDVSGSMDMPNRLPLLKSAFKLLVDNLRQKDTVSIVVYGSATGVWLKPTSGIEKEKIRKAIEELYPGGSTPGESGILAAYRLARSQFIRNGNNRVILATDGDFNVGQSSEDELEKMIAKHQESGIYLSCLGVGMGNYKDSKLEILAKKGNGNFSYLDNEREAEKILVKEFTQTMYSVADDAFLNIKFNPDFVRDYRLIGYDNKMKALADSLSQLEGGEIGSGHSLLAMFEISPANILQDKFSRSGDLAKATLSFRNPEDSVVRQTSFIAPYAFYEFTDIPDCYRFAASVSMFGALLKNSRYYRQVGWNDIIIMANNSYNKKDAVQTEFIAMVEKAKKIYNKYRKRPRS
ncbi:MAG TPA: von Willebrand factor type A domain-containing protein [Flavitalea sp.]|nr:von Willebrand factor type A domain-containing protein [Flavitalea sp.]